MTNADRHLRASEIFLQARRWPNDARTQRIETLTAGDTALRDEVLALLAHDVEDESPAAATPASATGSPGTQKASNVALQESAPLRRIGPYTIVDRIGRGGSGHVFLAEQNKPIQRRVAIKIVPQAAVNEELAARFDVERRALERMEHPNIARVLDAGRTNDGLPYLVMDYVEGETITAYCRRTNRSALDRIRLLLDVADAIQHAHQRGVIHRDIKPANILVTETNGRAVPHVLDFGIAKPIDSLLAAESPPTAGLPLGTPAYMAPEQTGLMPVDTRADVYALAAVLYELITGRPPIDVSGDPVGALQRVRTSIPAPASSCIMANCDGHGVVMLPRAMRADLDCILSCALEKSPERRYATVGAFADDLRRMLRMEPIQAHPATLAYRATRFVRRHRTLVAACGVIAGIASASVVLITLSMIETNRQRVQALEERDAQREINKFLTDDLLAAGSPDAQGKDITALEILQRASRRVDDRFAGRPLIAAAIHHTLGDAFAVLGSYEDAERHLKRAVEMRRAAGGTDTIESVHSEIAYASLLARWERMDEAEPALLAAVTRARLVLDPNDPAIYTAINDLGVVFDTKGRHEDARLLLEEALEGRKRLLGENDNKVFESISNLALVNNHLGNTDTSIAQMIEALRIAESQAEPSKFVVLALNNNIGATLQDLDRDLEAAPFLRAAGALAVEFLGPGHPNTLTIQGNLAGLEATLGNPERGAEIYARIVKERVFLVGKTAHDTLTARFGYFNCLWMAGRFEEAVAGFTELLADSVPAMGDANWFTVQVRASLARALLDADRAHEALPLAELAVSQFMAQFGSEHNRTKSAANTLAAVRRSLLQDGSLDGSDAADSKDNTSATE